MLELIILGVIPGTQRQVTFLDTLFVASILLLVVLCVHAVRKRLAKRHIYTRYENHTTFHFTSM